MAVRTIPVFLVIASVIAAFQDNLEASIYFILLAILIILSKFIDEL